MPLRSGHFERWLVLWRDTVDELFAGERAELAKAHAERVARAFHSRLEELDAMPPASGHRRHAPRSALNHSTAWRACAGVTTCPPSNSS